MLHPEVIVKAAYDTLPYCVLGTISGPVRIKAPALSDAIFETNDDDDIRYVRSVLVVAITFDCISSLSCSLQYWYICFT